MHIQKTPTEGSLLVIMVAVLITALVSLFLLGILTWRVLVEYDQVSVTRADYADVQSRQKLTAGVRTLARDTEEGREKLARVARGQDVVAAIGILEDAARASEVKLSIDAVSAAAAIEERAVSIAFSGGGRFSDTMHFVALLETLPFASSVEALELLKEDTGSAWRISGRIKVFVRE